MRHDPVTLRALAERCERGVCGPDFDRVIAAALGLGRQTGVLYTGRPFMLPHGPTAEVVPAPEWPPFTTSIDAQEALGVRIVGVLERRTIDGDDDEWVAEGFVEPATAGSPFGRACAPTEPLARLAAILRALAARAEASDG